MEHVAAFRSIWTTELRKLFAIRANRWILAITLVAMTAMPWWTLRNFDSKFEAYSWWYLDDSPLRFIIYSSENRLSWLLLIVIPWMYHLFFSMEHRVFLSRQNGLWKRILGIKALLYVLMTGVIMAGAWTSTFLMYQYWCNKEQVVPEADAWIDVLLPMLNQEVRLACVFPAMVILFFVFSRKWSYIILTGLLFFSTLMVLESPFQFHYNLQHERLNQEWLTISLVWAALMILGLWIFYRYVSIRTYVFP